MHRQFLMTWLHFKILLNNGLRLCLHLRLLVMVQDSPCDNVLLEYRLALELQTAGLLEFICECSALRLPNHKHKFP